MDTQALEITAYALIPAFFMVIGGWIGLIYTLTSKIKSIIQHLVAGIVFAAVSVDLLPKILNTQSAFTVGSGFAVGVIVMLLMMEMTHRLEYKGSANQSPQQQLPAGLLGAVLIDLFVDGILIGVSFIAGKDSGILITIALTTCVFFLGVSTAVGLKDRSIANTASLLWITLIAITMPLGAWVGSSIVNLLPAVWLTEVLAFGVAALLYLAGEELLVAAHKEEDSPWITSAFFWGFLSILLLKL